MGKGAGGAPRAQKHSGLAKGEEGRGSPQKKGVGEKRTWGREGAPLTKGGGPGRGKGFGPGKKGERFFFFF